MPEATVLHIRGRETDATRVVELNGPAHRVGRGAQCEVRLADPMLAEVQCLIRLRGETWHVQPVGPAGLVSLGDRPVDHLSPMPPGVSLRVGIYRMTLQPPLNWGAFDTPIEVGPGSSSIRVAPQAAVADPGEERIRAWRERLDQREHWLQSRQGEKRWEARWRAAGENLRARNQSEATGLSRANRDTPRTPPLPQVPPESIPASVHRAIEARRAELIQLATVPVEPAPVSIPEIGTDLPAPRSPAESFPAVHPSPRPVEGDGAIIDPPPDRGVTVAATPSETPDLAEADPGNPPEAAPIETVDRGPSAKPSPLDAMGKLPLAAAIFAAQGTRPVAGPSSKPSKKRSGPKPSIPTDPVAPGVWSVPSWLAGPPALIATIGLVGLGTMLGTVWSGDNLAAEVFAQAALRAEGANSPLLDPTERPETRLWRTTSGHMALGAAAIERSREANPRVEEVADAIESAHRASPLDPTIRLARVGPRRGDPNPREAAAYAEGLARDSTSQAQAGRVLGGLGHREAAILAFRRALDGAARAELVDLPPPTFDDDPATRRYRLPRESRVAAVAAAMLAAGVDPVDAPLPPIAVARLAVGRVLRDQPGSRASRVLASVLADDVIEPAGEDRQAEHHAARGEALALLGRPAEGVEPYRRAIASGAIDDATRRRWCLALAELLSGPGSAEERSAMLDAARGDDPREEITRKALDAQALSGARRPPR